MRSKTRYLLEQQAKFTRGESDIDPSVARAFNPQATTTKAEEPRRDNAMPSLDEIFTQLARDEVEDPDEEVVESGGLPVISRAVLEERQKAAVVDDYDEDDWPFGAPPEKPLRKKTAPEERKTAEPEIVSHIPSLDEILGKLDDELLTAPEDSTTAGTADDFSDLCLLEAGQHFDSERRLGEAMQTHPDQQRQWSVATFAPRAVQVSAQEICDVREHFDSQFHEAVESTSFLNDEAGFKTTRQSVPSAWTATHEEEKKEENRIVETEYATHYEYMQDVLQGHKKREMSTRQNASLESKPPNKRVESLPGMRMVGAPKKPARRPGQTPTSLKKGGEMERRIRHANAGGSLETMFEEDDDPDSKIPDCDVLFEGTPLRFTSVPQFFTCVSDCQRDDWRHIPKTISQEWRNTSR